jgi:hypothetical protein
MNLTRSALARLPRPSQVISVFGRLDVSEQSRFARLWESIFTGPDPPVSVWDVVAWWEMRRITFNIVVGCYGALALLVFFWAIGGSGRLQPGEDAIEPIALLAAPIAINVLYTLGWLVEVPARFLMPSLPSRFGVILLQAGLFFGLALSTLPAAYWVAVRLLQSLGIVA